jgi:hypothetical protein
MLPLAAMTRQYGYGMPKQESAVAYWMVTATKFSLLRIRLKEISLLPVAETMQYGYGMLRQDRAVRS